MPEQAKTFTVRWPGTSTEEVTQRLLDELDGLARARWGFLGYRRLAWEVRLSPDSADQVRQLGSSVRLDTQFGATSFVFPEDVEIWEAWATYEEMNKWSYVEEGADHWTA